MSDIDEFKSNNRVMKSYVWYQEQCFFVSTIDRNSSSMMGGRYAETMAWVYDWETAVRGEQVGMDESVEGSIFAHLKMCQSLHDTGKAKNQED
jgi:hypothetical protein